MTELSSSLPTHSGMLLEEISLRTSCLRLQAALPDYDVMPHRFGADGYVDMSVKNFNSWHQGSIDPSKIGFFSDDF